MEVIARSAVVVDDESEIRHFVRVVLAHAGYSVREGKDGKDALEKLRIQSADLLITDLIMPDMDGIELIRSAHDRGLAVTIVAISGARDATYLKLARHLGADYVLNKPFTIDELQRLLTEIATVGPPRFPKATS
jgi:CheY-like chemotaxis protein